MRTVTDTVIRVDLDRLGRNMDAIAAMCGPGVAVMPVIKANGYGHGAIGIAPTLIAHGASYLAVARLEEAMELREAFPEYPLFILGFTPDRLLETVVANNITQTVWSLRQAKLLGAAAKRLNTRARVHLKVDSGFHRLGTEDADELYAVCMTENIDVEGIFSHLALASREEDERQLARFMKVAGALEARGVTFRYKHIADSISAVDYPDFRLSMIRPGALVFGMKSFVSDNIRVEQVISFESRISQIHTLEKGEGVSYDYLWRAPERTHIATVPFGYADGYPRNMRSKGYVTIRRVKCPIIGVICMDQCMVDLTAVPEAQEGDPVAIYGDGSANTMTIQEASTLGGTNKNEIISRLTGRPARIYTSVDGEFVL